MTETHVTGRTMAQEVASQLLAEVGIQFIDGPSIDLMPNLRP